MKERIAITPGMQESWEALTDATSPIRNAPPVLLIEEDAETGRRRVVLETGIDGGDEEMPLGDSTPQDIAIALMDRVAARLRRAG